MALQLQRQMEQEEAEANQVVAQDQDEDDDDDEHEDGGGARQALEIADESDARLSEEVKDPEFAQLVDVSVDDESQPIATMASESEPLETFDQGDRQAARNGGATDLRAIRLAALRRQSSKNQDA